MKKSLMLLSILILFCMPQVVKAENKGLLRVTNGEEYELNASVQSLLREDLKGLGSNIVNTYKVKPSTILSINTDKVSYRDIEYIQCNAYKLNKSGNLSPIYDYNTETYDGVSYALLSLNEDTYEWVEKHVDYGTHRQARIPKSIYDRDLHSVQLYLYDDEMMYFMDDGLVNILYSELCIGNMEYNCDADLIVITISGKGYNESVICVNEGYTDKLDVFNFNDIKFASNLEVDTELYGPYNVKTLKKKAIKLNIDAKSSQVIRYKVIKGNKYIKVTKKGTVWISKGTPRGVYIIQAISGDDNKYRKEQVKLHICVS